MKNIFKSISWNDVTLEKFIKIQDILNSDVTDDEKTIDLVKLLIDQNADDLTPIEFFKLADKLSFMKEPIKREKIRKRYVLNDIPFKCITALKDLTTAQFIDYSNLIKEKIDNGKIIEIIAILLIPEGKKYNTDYDIDEVKEIIAQYMTVEEAFGIADFFTQSFQKQLKVLGDSLIKKIASSPELSLKERLSMTIKMKKVQHQLRHLLDMVF